MEKTECFEIITTNGGLSNGISGFDKNAYICKMPGGKISAH